MFEDRPELENYILLWQQLKQELAQKGYFDFEERSRCRLIQKNWDCDSTYRAAIEDIKSIAKRRNPSVQLYLYPSKVQGEGAGSRIARGIRYFDTAGVDDDYSAVVEALSKIYGPLTR